MQKFRFSFIALVFTFSPLLLASSNTHFKTFFGECPSKVAGELSIELIKRFEKSSSLKDVKNFLLDEKIKEKFFIESYKIKRNPMTETVTFSFQCPRPIMKVQIFKSAKKTFYTAVLTKNGDLLDPSYEVFLKAEGKIKGELPFLAMPLDSLNKDAPKRIGQLISQIDKKFMNYLSEVILEEDDSLTFILSVEGRPSSIFLGNNLHSLKIKKMINTINYLKSKNKVPSVVNLTNAKKVVVKFSESI